MNLPPITINNEVLNTEQVAIVRNALKAYVYELKMERLENADAHWKKMNKVYVEQLNELIKKFE